ncbi:MAG: ParB/RepB/Spo0J family partition protein [Chloroflexota bacterium]|nr:ParB/RepB/Spo0J family partition protein [Chloroflexota bacterium]
MDKERRVIYLDPRNLLPSQQNVRSDPGDLARLADTIREFGLLQPLGVRPDERGYRVVYGDRRRKAAIDAGLTRVPCIVLDDLTEADVMVRQMLENLQRLDLGDMEKAQAFERLLHRLTDEGFSQSDALEEMGRMLGLSSRQIRRYLRLRELCPEARHLIAEGELGVTHGQHLVGITPDERQARVAHLAVEEGLSAAELSRLCTALRHNANIDPSLALHMLRRGERVAVIEERSRQIPPAMPSRPSVEEEDTWAVEAEEEEESFDEFEHLQPTAPSEERLQEIGSLDEFMGEVQRLAQCVEGGRFQRLLAEDEGRAIKLGLAARQLRFLADAVSAIVQASGGR